MLPVKVDPTEHYQWCVWILIMIECGFYVNNRAHDKAGHWTFSETLHEFVASCSSDRATCFLILNALPHILY